MNEEILKNIENKIAQMKYGETNNIINMLSDYGVVLDDDELVALYYVLTDWAQKNNVFIEFDNKIQNVGQQLKEAFKIASVEEIIINKRLYNGCYGRGSNFKYEIKLLMHNNEAVIIFSKETCTEETPKSLFGSLQMKYTFFLNDDERENITSIINEIKSNDEYKYNETHYKKEGFDVKWLHYIDVIINGEEFELLNEDKKIEELLRLFKYEEALEFFDINKK